MIRMAAKQPVSNLESLARVHHVGEIFVCKTNRGTEIQNESTSSPVAKANRHTVGIIFFKSFDVIIILHNEAARPEAEAAEELGGAGGGEHEDLEAGMGRGTEFRG